MSTPTDHQNLSWNPNSRLSFLAYMGTYSLSKIAYDKDKTVGVYMQQEMIGIDTSGRARLVLLTQKNSF